MTRRTRRQTPGVIANNSPAAQRQRYETLRQKRMQLAQRAGFDSDKKLLGAMLKALESGPQDGHQILSTKRHCQKCGCMTDIANMHQLQGWLLLQPICIHCAQRGA